MVFRLKEQPTTQCPGCGEENAGVNLEDVEWYVYCLHAQERMTANGRCSGNTLCAITYRRIVEEDTAERRLSTTYMQYRALIRSEDPVNLQHYTRLHILRTMLPCCVII